MDFGIKSTKIVFILLSFHISMTKGLNVDCNGKPFHCVNTTHFKICVDLGGGVSKTVDDFLLPCPINTYCRPTNNYECEYYETTTTTTTTTVSELNVMNDFEASVIPLVSQDEKLNSTFNITIQASNITKYNDASVPHTLVISIPSTTDNQITNLNNDEYLATTPVIEDLNIEVLTDVNNHIAFKTMKDEIKYNNGSLNISVDNSNSLANDSQNTTNITMIGHGSSTTETTATVIKINNVSVEARLPTVATSYILNSKNNETSFSLEARQPLHDAKSNNTFVTHNSSIGSNPILYTNKSVVEVPETVVLIKNEKKIDLANIIATPATRQEYFYDFNNETTEHSLIGNDTSVIENFTFDNNIIGIENLETLVSNVTDNINNEITTTKPIEEVITQKISIPPSTIETTEQYTTSTDLSHVDNSLKNNAQIFYDWNNSSVTFEPQLENVIADTTENHEPTLTNVTTKTNINFTVENYISKELRQNDTEKYLTSKDQNNTLGEGLNESIIRKEQNHYVSQEVTTKIISTNDIMTKTDKGHGSNATSDNLYSDQNFTSLKSIVVPQLPLKQLSNEAEHISIDTVPIPSAEGTSEFSLLVTVTENYELTTLKKDLLSVTVYQNNQDTSSNVSFENNTKTPSTESNKPKLFSHITSTTNTISTTEQYNSEKHLVGERSNNNNSTDSKQEIKVQTPQKHRLSEQNTKNFSLDGEMRNNLNLINNSIASIGLINNNINKTETPGLIINTNISFIEINSTLNNKILRKDPATSIMNKTENIIVRFTPTPSLEDINSSSAPVEKFEVSTKSIPHMTEIQNNSESKRSILSDANEFLSVFNTQIADPVTNAPESYESKLLNNLNFTTNVMNTTEDYRQQLPQNDSNNYVVDDTTYSYTIDDSQGTTLQTELKYTTVLQQGTTNAEVLLIKKINSSEINLDDITIKEATLPDSSSNMSISNSTIVTPTTEWYQPNFVPDGSRQEQVQRENVSDRLPNTKYNITGILTSTEKYNSTVSSKSNFKLEDNKNILMISNNVFSPSIYNLTTLPSSPTLHKANSNNSNIFNQIDYTTMANDDLRNENTIHTKTEPTLLNIKESKPNILSSTNNPLKQTRSVNMVIEQPSLLVTKMYETRHTTISPTVNTYMPSTSSTQFEEIISTSTEILKTNSKMMDAPAEKISSSIAINNNNNIRKIMNDIPAQVATTFDTLTAPKLLLNSTTDVPIIGDDKTLINITDLKVSKLNDTVNQNIYRYNPGLKYKNNTEKSDLTLINVLHNRENTTVKGIANNSYVNVNLMQMPNKLTVLLNDYETSLRDDLNPILNKNAIPNQVNKNVTYGGEQKFETKKDININVDNKTSKSFLVDKAKTSQNKVVNASKPSVHAFTLENRYEIGQSAHSKINGSSGIVSPHDPQNSTLYKNSILSEPEISQKTNKSQMHFTAINATDASNQPNITTNKNKSSKSLAELILAPSKESKIINTNLSIIEHKTIVHNPYCLQKVLDKNCQNLPTGKYADKNDCKKFYLCLGEVHPYIGECPNGTVFSESKKQCTKNLSQCYRNNQFTCLSAGRYYDLRVKNVYYICVQNKNKFIKFKFQCQNGYTLNKTIVQCIKDPLNISSVNSMDSSSTNDESTSISIEYSTKGAEESKSSNNSDDNDNEFVCKKEGKFPYPDDCNKYYLCSKTKKLVFRRRLKNCDSGEIFDKEKQKCIDSDSRECK